MICYTKLKGRMIAYFKLGRKVFIIKDLNRIVLSLSKEQCEKKFYKHECEQVGLVRSLIYVFLEV